MSAGQTVGVGREGMQDEAFLRLCALAMTHMRREERKSYSRYYF